MGGLAGDYDVRYVLLDWYCCNALVWDINFSINGEGGL